MYEKARKYFPSQAPRWALLFLALALPCAGRGQQQSFEGVVKAIETTASDTVHYLFHVKDDRVRVDVLDKFQNPRNVYLVDFAQGQVTAMDTKNKLYQVRPVSPQPASVSSGFRVEKVFENRREFFAGSAWQCIVDMPNGQGRLQYWLVEGDFFFFQRLFAVWGNADYFKALGSVADIRGQIPMEITSRTATFATRGTFRITEIDRGTPPEALFALPAGYLRQ